MKAKSAWISLGVQWGAVGKFGALIGAKFQRCVWKEERPESVYPDVLAMLSMTGNDKDMGTRKHVTGAIL